MILAVHRPVPGPEALARASAASGIAPVDLGRRLQGPMPRVILTDADGTRVEAAAEALEALGWGVVSCDPAAVPSDAERLVVRRIELSATGFAAFDGPGRRIDCAGSTLVLVQRGLRIDTTTSKVHKGGGINVGKLVASVGLGIPMRVTDRPTTVTRAEERREEFLLMHRREGEDLVVYERRCDWRCLGAELTASSRGNLLLLARKVAALAPAAPHDDRLGRPGFVAGLPASSADAVDLGAHLILLTHLAGLGPGRGGG